ncbi:MAG: hypothetical protein KAS32_05575 [Candidatus Peribacteraceae bacterium]|nr:hypothetical protein [Candidatus Peribacteraceae bacterium]
MANICIERKGNMKVRVSNTHNDDFIESKSVEAHLMLAILEKLEEIRLGVVEVECAVTPLPKL